MRLLITRPADRAAPLKKRLEELEFEVSLAPLLTISYFPPEPPAELLQATLFTSVQGVEATKDNDSFKMFPAFAVGSKTAGAAGAAGFETVYNADGNVEDLLKLVSETCHPSKGLLLHLAGETTTGNLVQRLQEQGFEARYQMAYRAQAADGLPANVAEKISKRQIDGILFFSTRTAAIFKGLVANKGLETYLSNMQAFCLSENIAREAEALPWKKVHVSREATEPAMIELLQGVR